jgi:hypothetical protein
MRIGRRPEKTGTSLVFRIDIIEERTMRRRDVIQANCNFI